MMIHSLEVVKVEGLKKAIKDLTESLKALEEEIIDEIEGLELDENLKTEMEKFQEQSKQLVREMQELANNINAFRENFSTFNTKIRSKRGKTYIELARESTKEREEGEIMAKGEGKVIVARIFDFDTPEDFQRRFKAYLDRNWERLTKMAEEKLAEEKRAEKNKKTK
jgi:hypothetical protein